MWISSALQRQISLFVRYLSAVEWRSVTTIALRRAEVIVSQPLLRPSLAPLPIIR